MILWEEREMLELLFDWEDCATCKEVFIYHIFMYFIKRFIYFSILIDKYLEYVFSLTHFFWMIELKIEKIKNCSFQDKICV